jgi:hypothetical protein
VKLKKGAEGNLTIGPISDVRTLKSKRDELFRDFEDHPGKLALAREIKKIDDQIAELTSGKKKTGAVSSK